MSKIQLQMVTCGFLYYGNADETGEISSNNNTAAKCFACITCPFILEVPDKYFDFGRPM